MTAYYEIPQNCSYIYFAKTFINLKLYTAKYVQQFNQSNKTILYVGNQKLQMLPANISILTFNAPNAKIASTSSVCFSIRLNDLNLIATPYEYIANKICSFPYILSDAVLHTEAYGVQRLVFI